MANNSYVTR